jgi:hypothetical protein
MSSKTAHSRENLFKGIRRTDKVFAWSVESGC